jgi:WD40 repeat protein
MLVLSGTKGDVTHIAFSPTGKLIAASGGGRALELWDLPSGNMWPKYDKDMLFRDGPVFFHPTEPICLAYSMFSVAEIETDTKKGRMVFVEGDRLNRFGVTTMIPGGSGLICHLNAEGFRSGDLQLLKWRRKKRFRVAWKTTIEGHSRKAVRGLQPMVLRATQDGTAFITLEIADGQTRWSEPIELVSVTVWSAEKGKRLRWAKLPKNTAVALAVAPEGLMFVTCQMNSLCVWNASDLEAGPRLVRSNTRSRLTAVEFHPSGKYLAATSNDATVKLYDTQTWQVAKSFTWDIGRMRSIAFSPDGTLAAAGSDSGKVVVWDLDV